MPRGTSSSQTGWYISIPWGHSEHRPLGPIVDSGAVVSDAVKADAGGTEPIL